MSHLSARSCPPSRSKVRVLSSASGLWPSTTTTGRPWKYGRFSRCRSDSSELSKLCWTWLRLDLELYTQKQPTSMHTYYSLNFSSTGKLFRSYSRLSWMSPKHELSVSPSRQQTISISKGWFKRLLQLRFNCDSTSIRLRRSYQNYDSTSIWLRFDYDKKCTCSFCREKSRRSQYEGSGLDI